MSYRGPRFYRLRAEFQRWGAPRTETFDRNYAAAHDRARSLLALAEPGDVVVVETVDDRFPANVLETVYYHTRDARGAP